MGLYFSKGIERGQNRPSAKRQKVRFDEQIANIAQRHFMDKKPKSKNKISDCVHFTFILLTEFIQIDVILVFNFDNLFSY